MALLSLVSWGVKRTGGTLGSPSRASLWHLCLEMRKRCERTGRGSEPHGHPSIPEGLLKAPPHRRRPPGLGPRVRQRGCGSAFFQHVPLPDTWPRGRSYSPCHTHHCLQSPDGGTMARNHCDFSSTLNTDGCWHISHVAHSGARSGLVSLCLCLTLSLIIGDSLPRDVSLCGPHGRPTQSAPQGNGKPCGVPGGCPWSQNQQALQVQSEADLQAPLAATASPGARSPASLPGGRSGARPVVCRGLRGVGFPLTSSSGPRHGNWEFYCLDLNKFSFET